MPTKGGYRLLIELGGLLFSRVFVFLFLLVYDEIETMIHVIFRSRWLMSHLAVQMIMMMVDYGGSHIYHTCYVGVQKKEMGEQSLLMLSGARPLVSKTSICYVMWMYQRGKPEVIEVA